MADTEKKTSEAPQGWRAYRQEITFLAVFLGLLAASFTLISLNWVNNNLIEPFTAGIAKASGVTLNLLGQGIRMQDTMLLGERFSVNIKNGCNGVEAMLIFASAVLAFPATWASRAKGLVVGLALIQLVNLIRVVALYLTGAYFPKLFDASHTVVWQTVVILAGVLLWIFWANRYAVPPSPPQPAAST
jgi:exosortase H (IPTLxxWG-CTERM-specific)